MTPREWLVSIRDELIAQETHLRGAYRARLVCGDPEESDDVVYRARLGMLLMVQYRLQEALDATR